MYFRDDVDIDYLHQRFTCLPDKGQLIWKPLPNVEDIQVRRWNGKNAGHVAGSDDVFYRKVKIDRKRYMVHRIIYAMVTGAFPDGELDHISGDKRDNRFCNLRPVSHQQNACNAKISIANISGHKGIHWLERLGKWEVCIGYNGDHYLGVYADLNKAIAIRDEAEQRLFGEYRRQAA